MGRLINPVILGGEVLGFCPKCRGAYRGHIHFSQIKDENIKIDVTLRCNQCGHSGDYFVSRDDGLPKVDLRHSSNGRLLGKRRKRVKKKNPDHVLRGQLAFDIPKDHGIIR